MPQNPSSFTQNLCPLPLRLLAMVYDSVIMFGLLIIASAVALPFGSENTTAFQDFWFTFWLFSVCFFYLGSCWRYGGITLGMRAWKIRLVSADGEIITWPRCLLRYIVALVSLLALGLGILWALVDRNNRCWHDLAARTLLIKPCRSSD